MNEYRKSHEKKQKEKLNLIVNEFPEYAKDYFNYCEGTLDRSMNTLLGYAYDIRVFYQFLINNNPLLNDIKNISIQDLNNLTVKDIQEYMSYLRSYTNEDGENKTNEASSRARKLSSLRSYMQYLFVFDDLNINLARLIETPKIRKKQESRLDHDEATELIQNVEYGAGLSERQQKFTKKTSLRDTAIITLFLGSGIRVSELVGLNLSDIDNKNKTVKVTRKGGNEDIVYVGKSVLQSINEYINFERNPDTDNDALFLSSRGSSSNRLTVRSVERIVKKYGQTIGRDIGCHSLRRSFGTGLYNETGDIHLTANALGHKNIQVTADHYAEIREDRKSFVKEFSENFVNKEKNNDKRTNITGY